LERGDLSLKPQTEAAASIWPGRRPEDGRLRKEMGVVEADRMVRAVTHPYPGAFCEWEGRRLRIWETGAPSEDLVQEGALMRLQFADGWLDVKNATEEPL
jgi:methionyl-tRNA formyltransferase